MKKNLLCAFSFFLLFLTGCGDARETSVLSPVSALSFTHTDQEICIMAETAWQDSTEGTATPQYFSGKADTIQNAFTKIAAGIGTDLYFSHAQVLILDANTAKYDIEALCKIISKHSELRLGIRLAVAHNASSKNVLQAWTPNGEVPGFALERILAQGKNRGNTIDMPFFRFYNDLLLSRRTALPAVTLGPEGQVLPDGIAIFEHGKLTGFMEGTD